MNRHGSLTLLGIALAVLALHLPGVRRDLPYVHESDENQVVERAANVASTGDLNPHWF
ncbi:MAG: hypothetical protein IT352_14000, partial [Gemmatimonadales bacterium]|nr:hypothetical protein [Gemmatimonadales bacterium]